jgi:hypothetical protein
VRFEQVTLTLRRIMAQVEKELYMDAAFMHGPRGELEESPLQQMTSRF